MHLKYFFSFADDVKLGKQKVKSLGPLALPDRGELPRLRVAEISSTKQRFSIEGLILNLYGMFDTD